MPLRVEIKGLEHILAMTNPAELLGIPVTTAMLGSVIAIEGGQKRLAPVDRGRLRGAISHEVDGSPIPKWGKAGVIGGDGTLGTYAAVMDQGRRAGAAMPPVAPIAEWLRRHGSNAPPFVVARAIGRRGIKGKNYIRGGYDAVASEVEGLWVQAARDIEARWRSAA